MLLPILSCKSMMLLTAGILSAITLTGCRNNDPDSSKAGAPSSGRPLTIAAVGDSLTEGYGVDEHQAYPALLEAGLRKAGHKCTVINAGISGETTTGLLARMNRVLALKPHMVILCTGANDGLMGLNPDRIRDNISRMVRTFKSHRITVVLAGMKMLADDDPSYTDAYERLYPDIAQEENVLLIPFLLEGVAGRPQFTLPDGIHPNARGYQVIAAMVHPYVLHAMEQMPAG